MRTSFIRTMAAPLTLFLAAGMVLAACGGDSNAPSVADARIGAPTGPNAALYFTARGYGEDDALISASTDVASEVQLHETSMGEGGTMSMAPVDQFELPGDGQLVLEPGGLHLMMLDVDDLEVGSTVSVELTWEKAGEMTIEAEVVEPAETMGDGAG